MIIKYRWPSLLNKISSLWIVPKIILFTFIFTTYSSFSTLSAVTLNTIIGHGPQYTGSNTRLGFTVNDSKYSEANGNIASSTAKAFDASLTFNDFVIDSTLDFYTNTDYTDVDGDTVDKTKPISYDRISYTWLDSKGNTISSANYNQTIGCNDSYTYPLTLQITATNIKTFSQYGDPRESESVTLTKAYQILPAGICYAKPYSVEKVPTIQWYSFDSSGTYQGINLTNYTTANTTAGGGYTADYVPNQGFKAIPTVSSVKFPTSGFIGAKFQLVVTGNQSDYTFSINSGDGVTLADGNGYVRFTSKPSGSVTIRATLNSDTSNYHDYSFDVTNNWVIPKSRTVTALWSAASTQCGGVNYLATRATLTNSPQITAPSNYITIDNSWTRAIGGGVFAEWGPSNTTGYPDSLWSSSSNYVYYWTNEDRDGNSAFVVSNTWGDVNWSGKTGSANRRYVVCKG